MVKEYLRITDDPAEIREIALRLIEEITQACKNGSFKKLYTPHLLGKMKDEVAHYFPEASKEAQEQLLNRFIYDYWVYGCTIDEEFYLGLVHKSDEEKRQYMVRQMRHNYVRHLNWNAGPDRVQQLEDKYRLYQRLKPYYKRDMIEIRDSSDYDSFAAFAEKHPVFVVKPADFSFGIGVHKISMADYNGDYRAAMEGILSEGTAIHKKHPSKVSKMVLEELIEQDESLAVLHRDSVNVIRVTTVRAADGRLCFYHPWIKVGINGSFVATAVQEGFVAEIDPESGVVISDGYQETGSIYKLHPNTGIKIRGFQVPRWNELLTEMQEIMAELPEYGYIGWDMALTPEGWCIIEGNYSGEFMFQLINNRGYREDFEQLIGWRYTKEYWWEGSESYTHI